MKPLFIIIFAAFIAAKSSANTPPIDTLLLLKTRIENNKSYFINKPFKVLTDTLRKLKLPIIEYSGAHDNTEGIYNNDTIWVSRFTLYFEKFAYSKKERYHDSIFFRNKGVDTTNTHIKLIRVKFKSPIPFTRSWKYLIDIYNNEHNGISGVEWNSKIAYFYRNCIIKDLKIEEY